jgi:hypothetical protein
VFLALLIACGHGERRPIDQPADERWSGDWSPAPADGGEVVATVNGASIYAGDVVSQARAESQTAEQALATLIDAELLAQEARRRGLTDAPEVVDARKRVRVRRFVDKVFLPTFEVPDDVPAADVERAYASPEAKAFYDHPEWRTVAWARAPVALHAAPEADAAARSLARGFADLARAAKVTTTAELGALALLWARLPSGEFDTSQHGPAVPEFARAAFDLAAIGDVGEPVRTRWGWDVLLLLSINPERHAARADALADIRARLFDKFRLVGFVRWADGFVARAHVDRAPDKILDRVSTELGTF